MSLENIPVMLERCGALWQWKGTVARGPHLGPHAILTSGLHSDGYINLSMLLSRPWELSRVCLQLALQVTAQYGSTHNVDWIVGSAVGGITIAHEVAKHLNARSAFTEKKDGDMELARFSIPRGSHVLVVEDVMTTGETSVKTIRQLQAAECKVNRVIATLIARFHANELRTPQLGGEVFQVSALAHLVYDEWQADDCPLCKRGSRPLRPKQNWHEFLAA